MFFNHYFIGFTFFVFEIVKTDYLPIIWNISTNRGNSYFEREYKYPMYQEVAPLTCDLTDSCDAFCAKDADCDEFQRLTFVPSKSDNKCGGPLSFFDCQCDGFDKPEWFSVFCYVYKNPIYLGKFFKTPQKIEKYGTLKILIEKKHYSFNNNKKNERSKAKVSSQYGSSVMTFVPVSDSFPSVYPLLIKVPLKDSSYACKSNSVIFGFNHLSLCLTKVNKKLCQNGHALSMLPYLVQGNNLSTYNNMPTVLRDLDFLKGIETEIAINCVGLKASIKKFKKHVIGYFEQSNIKPCSDSFSTYHTVLTNHICQNVLVYVHYRFIVNGSDFVKLKVEYGLTDVPFVINNNNNNYYYNDEFSENINLKYIYLKQKYGVNFFDIMARSNAKQKLSINDELLNRGYFVGEELNFGYKHFNNISTTWERGILGVFRNGDSCNVISPVTFGFDYFSVCHIRTKFSNCSHFRSVVEETFEALLKGDSLAVSGNLRPPYNNTVPLLRNYMNSSEGSFENSSKCRVPVVQDILIQYTSIYIARDRFLHRVLGIRIDRAFQNVTFKKDVTLTSRVLFSYVSSSKRKPLSKFWKGVYSAERSENSWLYILNAFDDITPLEQEEITFWCILFVLVISTLTVCTKLNVDSVQFFFIINRISNFINFINF